MAARAGLTRRDVVDAAVSLLDEGVALGDVSLGAVARRLGIRPQSLYAHVDGVDGLRRAVATVGLELLAPEVVEASIGRVGVEAVDAIVRVHLEFAKRRPGFYEAMLQPPGDDRQLAGAMRSVAAPLEIVLSSLAMVESDRVHWTRLFLSTVYGYVSLQHAGRFSLPVEIRPTEDRLVRMLTTQLAPLPV